jgi:hypothetical protein
MPFLSEKKKENGRTREGGSGPPAKNELVGHPIKKYHAPLEPIIWTVYGENGAGNAISTSHILYLDRHREAGLGR